MAPCQNRTQAALVEGKSSDHCAIPAPQREKKAFGFKYVHLYLAHELGTKFRVMQMYWGIYDPCQYLETKLRQSFLTQ